jgi:hypothetical protein
MSLTVLSSNNNRERGPGLSSRLARALLLALPLLGAASAHAQTNNANPVLPTGTTDPDLQYFGGSYRLYSAALPANPKQVPVYSSPDLLGFAAGAAPALDLGPNCAWETAAAVASGPTVVLKGSTYYMYFATDGKIGVATSASATGPFVATAAPLVDADTNAPTLGSPAVFVDTNGSAYLYYGGAGVLVARALNADMVSLAGTASSIITPTNYTEAPQVLKRDGRYYLFYSNGSRAVTDYNTQYATAAAPAGPFTYARRIIYGDDNNGPGSASVFKLPGCDEYYFAYQAFIKRDLANRAVCLDHLNFEVDGMVQEVKTTTYSVAARTPGLCSSDRIVSGAAYRLTHKGTVQVLAADNNGTTAGTRVRQQPDNASNGQRWIVSRRSDGFFDLVQAGTTQALQTVNGSQANGAPLEQNARQNDNRQRWQLELMDDGYYKITLKGTTRCLEVASNSSAAGAVVQLFDDNGNDAQRWKLEVTSVPVQSGGVYKLIHKGTILAMDVDGNSPNRGAGIGQYFDTGNDAQRWIIDLDATKNSYKLTHRNAIDPTSNLPQCLDVDGNQYVPTGVHQYDDNGNDAQRWDIVSAGLDYVKLIHHNSPPAKLEVLDVQFGNANLGTRITQYDDNGSDGQQWLLQLVDYSAAPCNTGFAYASTTFCQGSANPTATITGTAGGVFSIAPATGLSINASTGAIDLTSSLVGTYAVTYTAAAGCTNTINVTVVATPATPTVTVSGTAATGLTLSTPVVAGATYQWFRNGTAVAGATSATYLVNSGDNNGSYTVVVTSAAGCASAASAATNAVVTATTAARAGTEVFVYPNPSPARNLLVNLQGYQENVRLTVFNALGQPVFETSVAAARLGQPQPLGLSSLAAGVYTLRAQSASTAPQTRRFVLE